MIISALAASLTGIGVVAWIYGSQCFDDRIHDIGVWLVRVGSALAILWYAFRIAGAVADVLR